MYYILRNSGLFADFTNDDLVVCWGGHSIGEIEYRYSKEVGYQLGLRKFNICTGCGSGAMKGPMKGATIAHSKQRMKNGRYIGITEPQIIASEPPNAIVNNLVVMPDIEKRLEAFVRLGHGFIVFPGAVGTTEEILYLLGVLMHPKNVDKPFPLVFTGPLESIDYFKQIEDFIVDCFGEEAKNFYEIIINNPEKVAKIIKSGVNKVHEYRSNYEDAYYFNWMLHIDHDFQRPFLPTHSAMSGLNLQYDQPKYKLAANLRKIFSGIVSGNIKEEGIASVEKNGPYIIKGDSKLMYKLDLLLSKFCEDKRMKLADEKVYNPCYKIIS